VKTTITINTALMNQVSTKTQQYSIPNKIISWTNQAGPKFKINKTKK
jgi:hypothetical protein